MTVRIGINGFGRIGRNYLRAARSLDADVEVVAINDLTSAETLAHLLRYDSTHGRFGSEIEVADSSIILDSGQHSGHFVSIRISLHLQRNN